MKTECGVYNISDQEKWVPGPSPKPCLFCSAIEVLSIASWQSVGLGVRKVSVEILAPPLITYQTPGKLPVQASISSSAKWSSSYASFTELFVVRIQKNNPQFSSDVNTQKMLSLFIYQILLPLIRCPRVPETLPGAGQALLQLPFIVHQEGGTVISLLHRWGNWGTGW